MQASSLPLRTPFFVSPEESLAAVAKIMTDHKIDAVLVAKEGKVLGIVTEKDVVRAIGSGASPSASVSKFMSTELISAFTGEPLVEMASKMIESDIRHLPVIRSDGTLAGIVTIKDVLRALLASTSWP